MAEAINFSQFPDEGGLDKNGVNCSMPSLMCQAGMVMRAGQSDGCALVMPHGSSKNYRIVKIPAIINVRYIEKCYIFHYFKCSGELLYFTNTVLDRFKQWNIF